MAPLKKSSAAYRPSPLNILSYRQTRSPSVEPSPCTPMSLAGLLNPVSPTSPASSSSSSIQYMGYRPVTPVASEPPTPSVHENHPVLSPDSAWDWVTADNANQLRRCDELRNKTFLTHLDWWSSPRDLDPIKVYMKVSIKPTFIFVILHIF